MARKELPRKGATRSLAPGKPQPAQSSASPAAPSGSTRPPQQGRRARKDAAQPSANRRRSRLTSLVSSLKSQAVSIARKVRSVPTEAPRRLLQSRPASAASPRAKRTTGAPARPFSATPVSAKTPARVQRTSVVRKPPREPTVRARSPRAAAKPAKAPVILGASAPTTPATRPAPGVVRLSKRQGAPAPQRTPALSGVPSSPSQPVAAHRLEGRFSLPPGYGDDRIVLMVKDPWWLYAYWEIQSGTERAARSQLLPQEVAGLQSILRVYDVTGVEDPARANRSFDTSLSGLATNWYIHVNAPNRSFLVDIGLLANSGRFLLLARSNRVTTPRFGPSEIVDEAWAGSEDTYWKLFGASTKIGIGSSQTGWGAAPFQQLFSGSRASSTMAATSGKPAMIRGFWCRVDTDLVIHGATEPKSTVIVQGHPVAVRKDGTFSLRVALPAGTQTVAMEITSPDGRHSKTVTPVVALQWAGSLAEPAGGDAAAPPPDAAQKGELEQAI